MDLFVESIFGDVEMLTDFQVARSTEVNEIKNLKVSAIETRHNKHSFALVQNENFFIYDNFSNYNRLECNQVCNF